MSDQEIGLGEQANIRTNGFAIQCRVTTEDPANNFVPDYGRLTAYRSSGGTGIRLDAGTAFSGAVITPFYDSLLVKVTTSGIRFRDAARRMERCLQEFRIRGVKTNIPFLLNLIHNPKFLVGDTTTRFIDETPELFQFKSRHDRATRILSYIAEVIVNGHPEVKNGESAAPKGPVLSTSTQYSVLSIRRHENLLTELGPESSLAGCENRKMLITDTTMRAHQSLFATRMR